MGDDIPTAFDFAELFTLAARHVLRAAGRRELAFSFDYRGLSPMVQGDPIAMRRGLHRLFCGAIDVLESGFIEIDAEARITGSGRCEVRVKAAGRGATATQERLSAVLARLQLAQEGGIATSEPSAAQPRLRRVRGSCPITGVPIHFECIPSVGFVFTAQWSWTGAQVAETETEAEESHAVGRPAVAWLVDSDGFTAVSLSQRLRRRGWKTVAFASCADAVRRLHGMNKERGRPSLLLVSESQPAPPTALRKLCDLLSVEARCVYSVAPGSAFLNAQADLAGFEVLVRPFSPRQLQRLALYPSLLASAKGSAASPALSPALRRPIVLVVDDNEVNRVVVETMVRSLGFNAITAGDGGQALEHCKRFHPDIVLTDVEMPIVGGIEATRRLREMERAGLIAPCIVVAVTADVSDRARAACRAAGMDAYLTKPLLRSALYAELHRLCVGCVAGAEFRLGPQFE